MSTATLFPLPDKAATSAPSFKATPPFLPDSWLDRDATVAARVLFSGTYLPGGWEQPVLGMPTGPYLCQLFNLEGCLLTKTQLNENTILAGIRFVLADLGDDKIWAATQWAFQRGMTADFAPDLPTDVADARFLVFCCHIADKDDSPPSDTATDTGHWVAAIVDRSRKIIFWYNTYPEYETRYTKAALASFLVDTELLPGRPGHVDVDVTGQADNWECGMLLLDSVRTYFRERVQCGEASHIDWAASHLHRIIAARDDKDEQTIQEEDKIESVRLAWIAAIRIQLGSRSIRPIRVPEMPRTAYDEFEETPFDEPLVANNEKRQTMLATTPPPRARHFADQNKTEQEALLIDWIGHQRTRRTPPTTR